MEKTYDYAFYTQRATAKQAVLSFLDALIQGVLLLAFMTLIAALLTLVH